MIIILLLLLLIFEAVNKVIGKGCVEMSMIQTESTRVIENEDFDERRVKNVSLH